LGQPPDPSLEAVPAGSRAEPPVRGSVGLVPEAEGPQTSKEVQNCPFMVYSQLLWWFDTIVQCPSTEKNAKRST